MFSLIVELAPRPEYVDRLEKLLRAMTQEASREEGVQLYSVHRPASPSDTFILCEIYCDREAWAQHLKRPRIQSALKEFENLLKRSSRITPCEVVCAHRAEAPQDSRLLSHAPQ